MHDKNMIVDGFFSISQDMSTKEISLTKYGKLIKTIQEDRILSLDDLHRMLQKERASYFMEGL